jgi:hypothetical protein
VTQKERPFAISRLLSSAANRPLNDRVGRKPIAQPSTNGLRKRSEFCSLREGQGVLNVDAEITHGAFDLCGPQKNLGGAEVAQSSKVLSVQVGLTHKERRLFVWSLIHE